MLHCLAPRHSNVHKALVFHDTYRHLGPKCNGASGRVARLVCTRVKSASARSMSEVGSRLYLPNQSNVLTRTSSNELSTLRRAGRFRLSVRNVNYFRRRTPSVSVHVQPLDGAKDTLRQTTSPDTHVDSEHIQTVNLLKSMVDIPDEFICPITKEIFLNPVVASDGITYEEAAIAEWLRHSTTSPYSRAPMNENDPLYKNILLKALMSTWVVKHAARPTLRV